VDYTTYTKLVLELLEKGRISVDETLALIGKPITKETKTQQIRIHKKRATVITMAQHHEIVRTYIQNRNVQAVSNLTQINQMTIRGHLMYAGILPANDDATKHKVKVWRERHNMYLERTTQFVDRSNAAS